MNENRLVQGRFAWGRGYGVFSVSQSHVARVVEDIANQQEHHRKKSFMEEYQSFVEKYWLAWRNEETVETVSHPPLSSSHPAEAGC
ncbi:MAG: hypothetical protein FJ398_22280 [Verrucomicrobia bacterium]|nr:hypothetical protein [Verrucomicrobiota bacterium]